MHPTVESLARRLRVEPRLLGVLEECEDSDLVRFEALVGRAIEAEDAAVSQGFNDSLKFLPAPVRMALKKVVFGSRR